MLYQVKLGSVDMKFSCYIGGIAALISPQNGQERSGGEAMRTTANGVIMRATCIQKLRSA